MADKTDGESGCTEKKMKRIVMTDYKLTIILPCAGEGKRLGLKTPKELFEIVPNIRLIDFSLNHIRAFMKDRPDVRLIAAVVVRPWKMEVFEYVKEGLPGVEAIPVMFNDRYREWAGSVYSACDYFSKNNIVLLPDSYLGLCREMEPRRNTTHDREGRNLFSLALGMLESNGVVFGVVPCTDRDILQRMGAVFVEKNLATAFQDKPGGLLERYNGFWGCYAFRGEYGESLYRFLVSSIMHRPVVLEDQPFFPIGAFPLGVYVDLGTWESIKSFRDCPGSSSLILPSTG